MRNFRPLQTRDAGQCKVRLLHQRYSCTLFICDPTPVSDFGLPKSAPPSGAAPEVLIPPLPPPAGQSWPMLDLVLSRSMGDPKLLERACRAMRLGIKGAGGV